MPVSFTVAIPTHNRRETVLMAVESALMQSRPPVEVLVVADGCTDGTQEAVAALADERPRVLDLPKRPGYGYANRNRALEEARGDVVAWLGDDDLYLPCHLERVGEAFDHQEVAIVQALSCLVYEDSRLEPMGMDWRVPHYRRLLFAGYNRTPMSGVAHRPTPALEAGGWRDQSEPGGDLQLWRRLLEAGARSAMLERPTVLHFRATGREQAYADRIAQNRRHLETIRSPEGLARLRSAMALAIQRHAAELETHGAELEAHADRAREDAQSARDEAELAARLLEELNARVGAANARLAAQEKELVGLRRDSEQLAAIRSGAWWRLHERLLPALRLYWRARGRYPPRDGS